MSHSLDEHRIPGVGPMRSARLTEAGYSTLEDLVAVEVAVLAALPGFHRAAAQRLVDHARLLLESDQGEGVPVLPVEVHPPTAEAREEPAVIDLDEHPPTSKKALKRGLDAARRIEDSRGWLIRARDHARSAKKRGRRRRIRADLARLSKTLERAQREVLTHGLSRKAAAELTELLRQLERALRRFADRKVTKKRGRAIRDRAAQTRRALKMRIS